MSFCFCRKLRIKCPLHVAVQTALLHRCRVGCNLIGVLQMIRRRQTAETHLLASISTAVRLPEWIGRCWRAERAVRHSRCSSSMDKCVIKFSHCDKDIFCFFVPEECPECGTSFSGRRLEEAPISIPNPFTNGHKTPCAFLIAPAQENTLRYRTRLNSQKKFCSFMKKCLMWNCLQRIWWWIRSAHWNYWHQWWVMIRYNL